MNKYTVKEIEQSLAHGVKILSVDRLGKWIKCQLSREHGQGDVSISFRNWS